MDLEYRPAMIFFTCAGFDAIDEASGAGTARLDERGNLEVDLSFHLGDKALLQARRE